MCFKKHMIVNENLKESIKITYNQLSTNHRYIYIYIPALHYITLRYITLHCVTLHYVTLYYITLH